MTSDLNDAIFTSETLSYCTVKNYYMVMDSFEETYDCLMGCFVAFLRFYENYRQKTQFVWADKDSDVPLLTRKFGKGKWFLGELRKQECREIGRECVDINPRTIIVRRDWYLQFRDELILNCY